MSKKDKKEQEEIIEEAVEAEDESDNSEAEELSADEVINLELQQQLEDVRQEAGENLAGWQRSKAEFLNYKKRIEREQAQQFENAAARVITSFLPVLDDLDRALQNAPSNGDAAEWAAGIDLIYRKLLSILESEGVTPMQTVGLEFDPNVHEAIAQEESEAHESGFIIEEIQKGYLIGERVLRAALVRVAS